jgi:hypothetical protein
MTIIDHEFTLVQITQMARSAKMVFYGVRTPWWTFDPDHLYRRLRSGLPCDPRGGVLWQADKPLRFLGEGVADPSHYGKHGIRAFLLAYHGCVVNNGRPTCLRTWEEYNDLIDAGRVLQDSVSHND